MKNLVKISLLAIYMVATLPAFAFAQTPSATLTFSPASGSVTVNSNFTVDIIVNTNGSSKTTGADVIVNFDSTKVQYISAARPTTNNFYSGSDVYETKTDASIGANSSIEIGRSVVPGTLPADYPTGTGSVVTLTFKPLVAIGQTVTLTLGFTALGETTDSNVVSSTNSDLLSGGSSATFTVAAAPVGVPTITNISPTSGDQNLEQSVTITGTNFGTQGANSKVYIGTNLTTVTSWSATQIVVQIPVQPQLTTSSTWQIKVRRDDAAEATWVGYTYLVAGSPVPPPRLPIVGPEMLSYLGLAISAFGMAGLTYTQLTARKRKTEVEPVSSDSNSNLAI